MYAFIACNAVGYREVFFLQPSVQYLVDKEAAEWAWEFHLVILLGLTSSNLYVSSVDMGIKAYI